MELSGNYGSMEKVIETMTENQEEMKSTLEGIKSRLDGAEDWISELEDKLERNTLSEQQNEKKPSRSRRIT